jgi:hypothetical protein
MVLVLTAVLMVVHVLPLLRSADSPQQHNSLCSGVSSMVLVLMVVLLLLLLGEGFRSASSTLQQQHHTSLCPRAAKPGAPCSL